MNTNIQDNIKKAKNLINEIKEHLELDNNIPNQINIIPNKDFEEEKKNFIKIYTKLFGEHIKKYKNLYIKEHIYLSDNLIQILNKMGNNLDNLLNIITNNRNINLNKRNIDLNDNQKDDLENYIKKDLNSYKKEKENFMKVYMRRNNELLSTVLDYLDFFKSFKGNVKKLEKQLIDISKITKEKKNLFFENKPYKIQKLFLTDLYRKISLLIGERDELFSKIENMKEESLEKIPFKKLTTLSTNINNNLKDIYPKINKKREEYGKNPIEIQYINIGKNEMENIKKSIKDFVEEIDNINKKIKKEYEIIELEEKKYRLDILIIMDITSSMENYLSNLKNQFNKMINKISEEIPEALLYIGFIGYKDLKDVELGDDYIEIDFTINNQKIKDEINKIEPEGGNDIPEDVAGAFTLALNKSWKGNTCIAILITDSPCHGKEFHELDQGNEKQKDDYIDGVSEQKSIENLIHDFKKKNISLICLKLHNNTNKMFDKFKEYYKIENNETNFLYISKNGNLSEKDIIQKILNLFNSRLNLLIKNNIPLIDSNENINSN